MRRTGLMATLWPATLPALVTFVCISAGACSEKRDLAGPGAVVDDLKVTLNLADGAGIVVVDLEIRNTGSEHQAVRFPAGCNPAVLLHATGSTDGPALWDERAWRASTAGCVPVSRNAELAPGGAVGTRHELTDALILGDSLAAGSYRVTVLFTMAQPDTALSLPAGTIRLDRP